MRTVQDVAFGVTGQTIYLDAPEGRPSAVTSVSVYRWDQSDDDTAGSAIGSGSVETNPNTTTDVITTTDEPTKVPLTATTGIEAGRTYLLTNTTSEKEWVEVTEIASADYVLVRHPLHNIFASGSTFQTTRMTATVDSTWVADETNIDESPGPNPMFRVRWVYVVGGKTYVADTYFNLVRYPSRHGVTPQDIEAMHPGWLDRLPTDHRGDQGRRLIDEAYRSVKIDLLQLNLDDASIAEAEVVDELVRHKAIELGEWSRLMSSESVDGVRYQAAREMYTSRLDSLVRLTTKVPVRDSDGVGRKQTALGITQR